MARTELNWPLPPTITEPAPPRKRRSWGKVSHTERFRRQRSDLLRAAARLVGRKGYEGTRVADIVTEAGLSKSTFYEHFGSKEDCFVELHRRTSANMIRNAVATAEETIDDGPYRCLAAVIRSLVGYPQRDPRLAAALRTELGTTQRAIRRQREENVRGIIAVFATLARRFGTPLDDDDVELTAAVLVHGVTDILGDIRRDADAFDARLDAVTSLGCRAFGLDTGSAEKAAHPGSADEAAHRRGSA